MFELRQSAILQGGKYKIEKTLGQGGFGITYLAEQTNLGRKVCIKEFFMKEYGERTTAPAADDAATVIADEATVLTGVSAVTSAAAEIMGKYRDKFIKEAKTIAKLDHPGIVRIHDVFEENGTAYYVMDFIEGENLNDLVKRERALPEDRALGYIRQVADALSYVHGHNIMHLDVKPANILVRKSDDKAILIDFGMAKQYDSDGSQTSTTPVGLSVGYAPIEMTNPGGVKTFSPETDVYSLGATLYYLVTGKNPPSASERMEMIMDGEKFNLPTVLSATTANVIEQSMQARRKRIQTVNEFLRLLDSDNEKEQLEAKKKAEEAEAIRQEALRKEQEKAEAEKKRLADEKARIEAEQKRAAEEKAKQEAEAKRKEELRLTQEKAEAEKKRITEEKAKEDAESKTGNEQGTRYIQGLLEDKYVLGTVIFLAIFFLWTILCIAIPIYLPTLCWTLLVIIEYVLVLVYLVRTFIRPHSSPHRNRTPAILGVAGLGCFIVFTALAWIFPTINLGIFRLVGDVLWAISLIWISISYNKGSIAQITAILLACFCIADGIIREFLHGILEPYTFALTLRNLWVIGFVFYILFLVTSVDHKNRKEA